MCVITSNTIDEFPNYQKCSCGKHLWNTKTNNLITCNKNFFNVRDGIIRGRIPVHYVNMQKPNRDFCIFWILIYIILTICMAYWIKVAEK